MLDVGIDDMLFDEVLRNASFGDTDAPEDPEPESSPPPSVFCPPILVSPPPPPPLTPLVAIRPLVITKAKVPSIRRTHPQNREEEA